MRHRLIAAGLTALLAVSPVAAVPAQAAPLPSALTCTGVWVVVDFGSGSPERGCARSYGTGTTALRTAGFTVTIDGGFVSKISEKPSNPDPNKAYWSYWHATRTPDGSYSDWSYSSVGSDQYRPKQGDAEGWRYQSLSEGNAAPRAAAPSASAAEPEPTATPTKPRATAKASPTAKATSKATATASAKPSETGQPSASSSAGSSATPTPTAAAQSPSIEPTTQMTAVAVDAPVGAPDPGNPTGTIVAGAVALIAAGGLGGWWLVKGRRR